MRSTMTSRALRGLALAAMGLMAGCAAKQAAPTAGPPAPITAEAVATATVLGAFDTPITLVDGRYEGAPFTPGGASRPTATLLAPLTAFGDLDDAPGTDAAAVVATNEGGSGERIVLTVLGLRGDKATSVGSTQTILAFPE